MKRYTLLASISLALAAMALIFNFSRGLFRIETAAAESSPASAQKSTSTGRRNEVGGWVGQMRQLERVLVDGYPYFFTEAAFRAEKSSAIVRRHTTVSSAKMSMYWWFTSASLKLHSVRPPACKATCAPSAPRAIARAQLASGGKV